MPSYLSPGVYVEEVSSGSRPIEGVGTALAAFVGFTERGKANEPTLVTNWTQYTKAFGGFTEGAYLPHAVYGYFLNGGGAAYVVRVGANGDGEATSNASGPVAALGQAARAELTTGGDRSRPAIRVRALSAGADGNDLSVEVGEAGDGGDGAFKLVVKRAGEVVETFDNVTAKRGPQYVVTAVKERSKLIEIEDIKGSAVLEPRQGSQVALTGGQAPAEPASAPAEIGAHEYVGNTADRTGFAGLEAIENVTMLCVPDLMAAYTSGAIDMDGVKAVQLAMIAHCELMADRLAILDAPPGLGAQQVQDWRMDTAGYDSKYA
ncbi:MAG TPA: hypothetical protein VFQ44_03435, partial [Streptosporangiaceae bacterium]|nr:hypothetical protein [Streptosporangiaceae bacterium]